MVKEVDNELLTLFRDVIGDNVITPIPKNIDTIIKGIDDIAVKYTKIFYCKHYYETANNNRCCPKCNQICSYFFWVQDPAAWLVNIINVIGLKSFQERMNVECNPTHITDSIDSLQYERITRGWKQNSGNCISSTISVMEDGGSARESTNQETVVAFACCNELPINERFSYAVVGLMAFSSIWIPFRLLLRYFISKLKDFNYGKEVNTKFGTIVLKIRLLTCLLDLVAASDALEMVAHSGYSSCRFCNHQGIQADNRCVFPYTCMFDHTTRDYDRILDYFYSGMNPEWNNEHTKGIKGISILSELDYFDWTRQISADLLHNMLEGFCQKILTIIDANVKESLDVINGKCNHNTTT